MFKSGWTTTGRSGSNSFFLSPNIVLLMPPKKGNFLPEAEEGSRKKTSQSFLKRRQDRLRETPCSVRLVLLPERGGPRLWGSHPALARPRPLMKSTGREWSSGDPRKGSTSVRPTLGSQCPRVSKTISKVPKILPGSREETGGQRSVGTRGWVVKIRSIIVLGSITQSLHCLSR